MHYFALAFIILQGLLSLVFFFGKWEKIKCILLLYLIIALAYLPWLPSFIYQFTHSQGNIAWIALWVPQEIGLFLLDFSGDPSNLLAALMLLIILLYLGYTILKHYQKRSFPKNSIQKEERNLPVSPDLLLVFWFVLPVAITFGISITLKPIFVDRYLLFVLPAGYLLLARSIFGLPLKAIFKGLLSGLLVGFLFFTLIFTRRYYTTGATQPFRTVAQFINDSHVTDSIVITNEILQYSFEYYFTKMGSNHRVDLRLQGWEADPPKAVTRVIREHNAEYVWYIKQMNGPDDVKLTSYLDNAYTLVQYKEFISTWQPGFDVYLYNTRAVNP